jgi:hypothetical protein
MAQEKEYSEIVQEEAGKLKEILGPQKKKRSKWDRAEDSVTDIFTVLVGGPAIVVVLMGVGLVLCEMAAFVYNPSNF